jgi:hypothetical protein
LAENHKPSRRKETGNVLLVEAELGCTTGVTSASLDTACAWTSELTASSSAAQNKKLRLGVLLGFGIGAGIHQLVLSIK